MRLKFVTLLFLLSSVYTDSSLFSLPVEVGIKSIYNDKGNIIIDIYGINNHPIAGIQLDIIAQDLFTIDSAFGGRCLENNFTIYTNKKGRILAFSMKGDLIPPSISESKEENLLFSVYGKVNNEIVDQKIINIESILASEKGERLKSISPSFVWEGQ